MKKITRFSIPLEVAFDKTLGTISLEKKLFWIINSICSDGTRQCHFSNKELAHLTEVKNRQSVSDSLTKLQRAGYVQIQHQKNGRRSISVSEKYTNNQTAITDKYNKRVEDIIQQKEIHDHTANSRTPYGDLPYGQTDLINNSAELGPSPIYKAVIVSTEPKGSVSAAPPQINKSGVSNRKIERVLAHWNSKGAPLACHKVGATKTYKQIRKAVGLALKTHSESEICAAIDVYHHAVNDPTLTIKPFTEKKKQPRDIFLALVGLHQFFDLTPATKEFIRVRGLKEYQGFDGWFPLCNRGEAAVRERFARIPSDKFPDMTKLLRKKTPHVVRLDIRNTEIEGTLRNAARKLVKLHADVARRIKRTGITKTSPLAFVNSYFFNYLEEQNLENFHFRWLSSDKVLGGFVYYLEERGILRKPVLTRNLKRRFGRD